MADINYPIANNDEFTQHKLDYVDLKGVKDNAVTADMAEFIYKSPNLIDNKAIVMGKSLDHTDGITILDDVVGRGYYPEYVPVKGGDTISTKNVRLILFYNEDKTFGHYLMTNTSNKATLHPSSSMKFARFVVISGYDEYMANFGAETLPYEPYGYLLNEDLVAKYLNDFDDIEKQLAVIKDNVTIDNTDYGLQAKGDYYFPLQSIPVNMLAVDDYDYKLLTIDELYSGWNELASNYPEYITMDNLGKDSSGEQDIYQIKLKPKNPSAARVTKKLPKILITSNVHGGEKTAALSLYFMVKQICERWEDSEALEYLRHNVEFVFIPVVNPWGYVRNSYKNSNGVNIARNFNIRWALDEPENHTYGGTEPFTEIETVYVKNMIDANLDSVYGIDMHTQNGDEAKWYYGLVPAGVDYSRDVDFSISSTMRLHGIHNIKHYGVAESEPAGAVHSRLGEGTVDAYLGYNGIPSLILEHNTRHSDEESKFSSRYLRSSVDLLVTTILSYLKQIKKRDN